MEKDELKNLLMKMRTKENEAAVNHLLGLLYTMSIEELHTKLEKLNITSENIEEILTEQIEKYKLQQEHSSHFIGINKMFCYGITGDTIHMHLIPKDLRGVKKKLGDEAFYKFYKDQLEDFLSRLQDIFRNDSTIKTLFAVSPIFFNSNISLLHEELGFDKVIEIDLDNKEDKMEIVQKKFFINMFNGDPDHKKRVYYTSISREKLLETEYLRIPENEKTVLDD